VGTLLTIAATVISVVGSVCTIVLFAQVLRDRDRITWRVVESAMKKVLADLNKIDYKPDVVIGVGRGGAIVAGMLAGNLGHVPLFVVDTVLDRSKRQSEARVRYPNLCPEVKDKDVLVSVGELYSGEDLKAVVRYIEEQDPAEIRTMSLFSHPAASIRPDFLGKQTRRPLGAPWRITEAYRTKRL
jgi:hypoxanthine phosphoribosyltransferase